MKAFSSSISRSAAASSTAPAQALRGLNEKLIEADRKLSDAQGLPRRPWYQNLIYAPGFYTGYEAKTFPGVREGIEEKRYAEAEHEAARLGKALNAYADAINQAAAELEQAEKR
jgi:N-acetylated-alpha-linked acidic dipeptidase